MSPRSEPDDLTSCERCGQPHLLRGGPHPSCKGHRDDGGPCGQPRMRGQEICRKHGAKAKQNLAAGERRDQEKQAQALLSKLWNPEAAPITDSVGEMQRLAGSMRHAVDVLGGTLEDPDDLDEVKATAWLRVLRELRTLLADMKRLGIAEYAVNVEATRVKLMAVAFGRTLDAIEQMLAVSLSGEQREQATRVLLAELRAQAEVEGGAA